jgi:hypothetical protein
MTFLKKLRGKLRSKKKAQDEPGAQPNPPVAAPRVVPPPAPLTTQTVAVVESKPITPQHTRGPYSVTMEERIRYQRIVLGMTESEIQNALPPGQYQINPSVDSPSRPSGKGDLAYAYMVSA